MFNRYEKYSTVTDSHHEKLDTTEWVFSKSFTLDGSLCVHSDRQTLR